VPALTHGVRASRVAEVREEAFDLRPELHVDRRQGVDVGISHGSEPLARKPSLARTRDHVLDGDPYCS